MNQWNQLSLVCFSRSSWYFDWHVFLKCCAIDYIVHTLDTSVNQLLSFKHFPSRCIILYFWRAFVALFSLHLTITKQYQINRASVPDNTLKLLKNIIRRLTRIFANTWHHHNQLFVEMEVTFPSTVSYPCKPSQLTLYFLTHCYKNERYLFTRLKTLCDLYKLGNDPEQLLPKEANFSLNI